jgi:radical SAM protein with 4Fe4S-binding SPASM domain
MTGGEPLIAERFHELVLFTRLRKKPVVVISNGSGSSADYEMLLKLGVGLFEFPLHSAEAGPHDFMSTVPGSWEKSISAIREVKKMGGSVVTVIVITKANFENIRETLALSKELGVTRVMLNRYNIGGNGIAQPEKIQPTVEQIQHAFREANLAAVELGMSLSSNVCTPLCLLNPADYPNIAFTSCSSNILNKPLTMDIDGNMRICNHSPIVIGNIFKQPISEILTSPYLRQWKDIVPEFCTDCELFPKCMGGCRAASEQTGKGLETVDPILITDR